MSEEIKTCKNCFYCHDLRHNFVLGKGQTASLCCTYLYEMCNKGFIMEVNKESPACEEYKEKDNE